MHPDFDQVSSWLRDLGIRYSEGGAEGPELAWSITITFGGVVNVLVLRDRSLANAIQVVAPVVVGEPHRQRLGELPSDVRERLERNLRRSLLQRGSLTYRMRRDERGVLNEIVLSDSLLRSELVASDLVGSVHEVRNAVFDVLMFFEENFGQPQDSGGAAIEPSVASSLYDPEFSAVVLHRATLENLSSVRIAGETLDETIQRLIGPIK